MNVRCLLLLAALAGCAPPPPPPARPAIPAPRPAEASSSGMACKLHAAKPERWIPLYVAPHLPSYGAAYEASDLFVDIRVGPASLGASVPVRGEAWELLGVAPADGLPLHARRPMLLGEMVSPRPTPAWSSPAASGRRSRWRVPPIGRIAPAKSTPPPAGEEEARARRVA